MNSIKKTLTRPYDIVFRENFGDLEEEIKKIGIPSTFMIVTDHHVAPYYLETVKEMVSRLAPTYACVFEAGEHSKHFETVFKIYNELLAHEMDRSSMIIALGGGVVGDMAGFVASSYMRGIPFIQIPTTFVAQNDSSLGGKVGIDYLNHKNMVGAFYAPKLVYVSSHVLQTLPERERRAGLMEVIKHGLIANTHLYNDLKENREKLIHIETNSIIKMTYTSCLVKAKVVEEDPKEYGIRKILNFGHTIGHAIETLSHFELLHGECVGYGMILASYISFRRDLLEQAELEEIIQLIQWYGNLKPLKWIEPKQIYKQIRYDKKKSHGQVPFVLLEGIGKAIIVEDIEYEEVEQAIDWMIKKWR